MKYTMTLFLCSLSVSAFAQLPSPIRPEESKVVCTGTTGSKPGSKVVKIAQPYDSYSGEINEGQILEATVDGKPMKLSYNQLTKLYVSPFSEFVVMYLMNDGTETLFAVEYQGKNSKDNKIYIDSSLLGPNNGSETAFVKLVNVTCEKIVAP